MTDLDLTSNQFAYLPAQISTLKSLQMLTVNNNALTSLEGKDGEDSLSSLPSLWYLSVKGNQLEYLPESISTLTSLTHLGLNQNKYVTK